MYTVADKPDNYFFPAQKQLCVTQLERKNNLKVSLVKIFQLVLTGINWSQWGINWSQLGINWSQWGTNWSQLGCNWSQLVGDWSQLGS